jgi:hypothetical protein
MDIKFTELISNKKLPMSNIAFLLVTDVVVLNKKITHRMRYSDNIKQFWHVGLTLFKGKFLRFMSDCKNQVQDPNGLTRPEDSTINFAVTDRKCLYDTPLAKKIRNIKPGVLTQMLQLVCDDEPLNSKSFKPCVDGNRFNVGATHQKLGDVAVCGYEGSPCLKEQAEGHAIDIDKLR